jgi:hypothetical protein
LKARRSATALRGAGGARASGARIRRQQRQAAAIALVLADEHGALRAEQLFGVCAALRDADRAKGIAAKALEVHRRAGVQAEAAIGIGALVHEDTRTGVDLLAQHDLRRGILCAPRASLHHFGRTGAGQLCPVGSRLGRGARARSDLKASGREKKSEKRSPMTHAPMKGASRLWGPTFGFRPARALRGALRVRLAFRLEIGRDRARATNEIARDAQ